MHISNAMLKGTICPVTAIISAIGIGIAAYFACRSKNKPSSTRFAAVTAFIFAAQMINFPITNGTSGHLLGGTLAAALLGTPFGILSIGLVLTIQCLIFADGGLSVLGANILNMAIIGAGLSGLIIQYLKNKSQKNIITLGSISFLSVVLSALACCFELAVSGTISLSKVITAMLGIHLLIGIGEALITVSAYSIFENIKISLSENLEKKSIFIPLSAAGIIALILSPFASSLPDGLEWVAKKHQFLHESAPSFVSPLPDYTVPILSNEFLSTGLAGIIGVITTFFIAWLFGRLLNRKIPKHNLY